MYVTIYKRRGKKQPENAFAALMLHTQTNWGNVLQQKKNRQNRRAEKQKNAKCERKLSHKKCSSQHTSKVNRSTNMCNEQSWWQKKKKKNPSGGKEKHRKKKKTGKGTSLLWCPACFGTALVLVCLQTSLSAELIRPQTPAQRCPTNPTRAVSASKRRPVEPPRKEEQKKEIA